MNAEQKRLATMLLGHFARDKQLTVTNEVSHSLVSSIRGTVDLERELRRSMAMEVAQELLKKSRIQWTDTVDNYTKKFRADAWIFTPDEIGELAIACYEAGRNSQEINL